ncbi:MAG: flavodoxin family protein [Dehalococcoidia bacterium]
MKLLIVCGSPRNGNTEWMLKSLQGLALEDGAEAELILLRKLDIKMCNGCLACEAGGKKRKGLCSIKDDMQSIYPKLMQADAIVFGTPVYFEMVSGLLKNFMDRTCPVWPRLEDKRFAGVAVAEEGIGTAIDNLKTYAAVCGMNWAGCVTALAKKPREVGKSEGLGEELVGLYQALKET